MNKALRFDVTTDEDEKGRPHSAGCFSRDMDDEEEMDEIQMALESGMISLEKALEEGRTLLAANPDNLELHNFVGCRLWDLAMRDDAASVWKTAYDKGVALIPKGFKGRISWYELDNRSFLRCCHGHLLGLGHLGKAREALALARKMLRWNPDDNLGVRFLVPDYQFMAGEFDAALATYLERAPSHPTLWYSAALIAFRQQQFVQACTYLRRGIAGNPYVAEGLTGRTLLANHLYRHGSNLHDTDFALDYLQSPIPVWEDNEIDFLDWVFNSSAVLKERATLMELHEKGTYTRDPNERVEAFHQTEALVAAIDDRLSLAMVRKVKNRWEDSIWPWDRLGFESPARDPANSATRH